ncbi:peptide ABC transporter substrate-binding protein [Rubeoparvulum massiliense]|uniref:peptide ABC transporter substrate-binding protein n=1 Tax=Rubeoparvulum massiliense TaxID=1631346 RepID=UPI00065E040A|nr:peptide ABC transporter substrate-binding protein [Rubeoparvulum massiliense]
MKRMNKWLLTMLAVVLVMSVALTGCGSKDEQPAANNNEPAEPAAEASEQVMHLDLSDEPLLDPQKAQYDYEFRVLNNVMEGLVRLDANQKATPGIAESWDISEDGMTWTFHLRDAKWSDGTPVTAQDFAYAWQRAVAPETGSIYAAIVSDHVKTAEAVDEKTLKVELANPAPYFETLMAFQTFFPAKQEFVEANGEKYGTDADKLLYNGPFMLTSWEHNNRLELKKNDNYWDAETVQLTEITLDIVKDSNASLALYEEGSIDRTGLAREQVPLYKDHAEFLTLSEPTVFYMLLNTKNEALQNANIRKAISYGFDRQAYCDVILNNGSVPASGLIPPEVPGLGDQDFRTGNGDLVTYDADKAKEYLTAGLKELGLEKLPTIRYLSYDNDSGIKGAEFFKENYKNLGIDITVENLPVAAVKEKRANGDFDIFFGGWGPDYWDPMTFMDLFVTDGPFNEGKWSNAQYDEAITFAKSSSDAEQRMTRMLEAEKILIQDEAGISPVFFKRVSILQKPYIKNYVTHPYGADADWKWTSIEGK